MFKNKQDLLSQIKKYNSFKGDLLDIIFLFVADPNTATHNPDCMDYYDAFRNWLCDHAVEEEYTRTFPEDAIVRSLTVSTKGKRHFRYLFELFNELVGVVMIKTIAKTAVERGITTTDLWDYFDDVIPFFAKGNTSFEFQFGIYAPTRPMVTKTWMPTGASAYFDTLDEIFFKTGVILLHGDLRVHNISLEGDQVKFCSLVRMSFFLPDIGVSNLGWPGAEEIVQHLPTGLTYHDLIPGNAYHDKPIVNTHYEHIPGSTHFDVPTGSAPPTFLAIRHVDAAMFILTLANLLNNGIMMEIPEGFPPTRGAQTASAIVYSFLTEYHLSDPFEYKKHLSTYFGIFFGNIE